MDHVPEPRRLPLTISCDDCAMQCTAHCDDCVVSFVVRSDGAAPELGGAGTPIVLDHREADVVRLFARAGLVPELRHQRAG